MRTVLQASVMAVSLALIGCGNADSDRNDPQNAYNFSGDWMGTLSSNSSPCSDGSSVPASSTQASLTIMNGGSGQIFWHAKCGDLYFSQYGNIATQSRAVTCTPTTTPTTQVTQTIHDSSLVLNGNALQVDMVSDSSVAAGGKTGFCNNVHITGTLVRTSLSGAPPR